MLFTLKTASAIAKAHVILLKEKSSFLWFRFILSSTLHRIRYIDFIVCSTRSSLQPASMRSNTIISVTGKGEFCRTGVIRQTCITVCGTQSCNRIIPGIRDFIIRHRHIKICMNYHSFIRNLPRIRRFCCTRNRIIHWLNSNSCWITITVNYCNCELLVCLQLIEIAKSNNIVLNGSFRWIRFSEGRLNAKRHYNRNKKQTRSKFFDEFSCTHDHIFLSLFWFDCFYD